MLFPPCDTEGEHSCGIVPNSTDPLFHMQSDAKIMRTGSKSPPSQTSPQLLFCNRAGNGTEPPPESALLQMGLAGASRDGPHKSAAPVGLELTLR